MPHRYVWRKTKALMHRIWTQVDVILAVLVTIIATGVAVHFWDQVYFKTIESDARLDERTQCTTQKNALKLDYDERADDRRKLLSDAVGLCRDGLEEAKKANQKASENQDILKKTRQDSKVAATAATQAAKKPAPVANPETVSRANKAIDTANGASK